MTSQSSFAPTTQNLAALRQAIDDADLVLIGASNGLDMAEGLNLFAPDAHFRDAYGDLAAAYGGRSILEDMFLSASNVARSWEWNARFAQEEWLNYQAGPVMAPLRDLVGDKDCFVVSCNIDGHFSKAGFDEDLVLETEGSVRQMVCSAGCSDERYSTQEVVPPINEASYQAAAQGRDIDEALIPRCPHCGAPLICAVDEGRLQHPDSQAKEQVRRLQELVARHRGDNVVVLELGVGLRNGVVKHVLKQAALGTMPSGDQSRLTYGIFNYNQVVVPPEFASRTIGVSGDMAQAFHTMEQLS